MKRFENYESQKIRRFGQNNEPKKLKSSVFGKKRIFFSAEMQISKQKRGSEIKNNYSYFFSTKKLFLSSIRVVFEHLRHQYFFPLHIMYVLKFII